MSKKELIRQILNTVGEYANCAADWEPSEEDDYEDFTEMIEDLVYSNVGEMR